MIAAFALAAVATGVALWGWLRSAPAEPMTQFSIVLRPSEALQPPPAGGGGRLAISPDGRQIVFVGPGQGSRPLWIRRLDQLTSTPIAGTEGALRPVLSPDGRQVGFIKNGVTVRIASLDGTPTVTLTDTANTTSADWSSDGWVYMEGYLKGVAGILRIRPTGGSVEPVYAVSAERHEVGAEFLNALPGGGLLFRLRYGGKGQNEFQIAAMKVPGGPVKVLTRGVFARYAPTGHLLVVTAEGKLIALPFDAAKLAVTGPPIALLEGVGVRAGGFSVDLALSPSGTLVYTTGGAIGAQRVVWVTREGGASLVDPSWDPQGTIDAITLSPDEKTLAVALSRNGKSDIWVKALPTGPFSRSPSATPAADARSGRPTAGRCSTSGTGQARAWARCTAPGGRRRERQRRVSLVHGLGPVGAVAATGGGWSSGARRHRAPPASSGFARRSDGGPAGELGRDQHISGAVTGRAVAGLRVGRVRRDGDLRAAVPRTRSGESPSHTPAGASRSGAERPPRCYLSGKNDLGSGRHPAWCHLRRGRPAAALLVRAVPPARADSVLRRQRRRPPVPDAAEGESARKASSSWRCTGWTGSRERRAVGDTIAGTCRVRVLILRTSR